MDGRGTVNDEISILEVFMGGGSTAAHQVEGFNVHSDSWALEQMKGSSYKEPGSPKRRRPDLPATVNM